jgi:hypothetical protein
MLAPMNISSETQEAPQGEETACAALSTERAVEMTAEIIEKYRPALEDLAK